MRLNSIYLNEYKVRHGFIDGTNSMCDCGSATETNIILSLTMPAVPDNKISTP